MAYTRATTQRIINRVRRMIDQVPYTDETVAEESDIAGSVTTTLSDAFIIDAIRAAHRNISNVCKACNIYDMIDTTPASLQPEQPMVRLLYNTVTRNGNRAVFRSEDLARRLERTGRAGSDQYPAFTWENAELTFYPNIDGGDTYDYHTVIQPNEPDEATDELLVDERLEAAVLYYAASMCYQRLKRSGLSDLAMQMYKDEIYPYRRDVITNRMDGQEVSTE